VLQTIWDFIIADEKIRKKTLQDLKKIQRTLKGPATRDNKTRDIKPKNP
jgi:hypothetical protein